MAVKALTGAAALKKRGKRAVAIWLDPVEWETVRRAAEYQGLAPAAYVKRTAVSMACGVALALARIEERAAEGAKPRRKGKPRSTAGEG